MDSRPEEVVADLPVAAVLPMGFERLTLFFTGKRIIVSHRAKIGAGSVPTTFIFGSLGTALGGLFGRRKKKEPAKPESGYPSPGRILRADKDNFSILYEEIVGVELSKTETTNSIVIHSRDDRYNFTCRTRFEQILATFEKHLGPKLTVTQQNRQEHAGSQNRDRGT